MRRTLGWIGTFKWIGTFSVGGAMAAAGGCATSAVLQQELTKTNTQTVLAFEETVFNKHEVSEAFAHYVGPNFVEHDSHLRGAVEKSADPQQPPAVPQAYAALIVRLGRQSQRVFLRTIAQGDLVATQSRWDTGQAPAINVVDIYRLHEGRIVEHWDVIQDRGGT
ncbi:MAG: nuclear transport factor 2 family protein [Rhodanobacteraceae bacterium]